MMPQAIHTFLVDPFASWKLSPVAWIARVLRVAFVRNVMLDLLHVHPWKQWCARGRGE